jgi:hypothetical protein
MTAYKQKTAAAEGVSDILAAIASMILIFWLVSRSERGPAASERGGERALFRVTLMKTSKAPYSLAERVEFELTDDLSQKPHLRAGSKGGWKRGGGGFQGLGTG